MSITLVFRTAGAWGAGKGSNLTATDVDNNFWNLAQAIENIIDNPVEAINIASVTTTGTSMTFVMSDSSTIGPIPLPVLKFRYLGVWQPNYAYSVLDTFYVNGYGIFTTQIAHTSGVTFDPDIEVAGSPALLQLFGATGFTTDATLAQLADVHLTSSLADGDFLVFDGGSTEQWIAVSPADVAANLASEIDLGDLANAAVSGATSGQVLTFNGTNWVPATPSGGGGGGGATTLGGLSDVEINSSTAVGDSLVLDEDGKWIGAPRVLTSLSDVVIDSSLASGDVLTFNGTNWVPATPSGGGGGGATALSGLTDVEVNSTIASGDVLTWEDDSNGGHWIAVPPSGGGDSNSGGGIDFTNGNDWSNVSAYDVGTVVQRSGGRSFVCWNPVSAPEETPSIDGTATGATPSGPNIVLSGLTTTSANLCVVMITSGDGITPATEVTSAHLTFTERAAITGFHVGGQMFTAPIISSLSSEVITVHGTGGGGGGAIAFGITDTAGFDPNGSLPQAGTNTTLTVDTTNSIDLLLSLIGTVDETEPSDPAGFTNIDSISNAFDFGYMSVGYLLTGSPQSGLTYSPAFGYVQIVDALATSASGNTPPEDDSEHWLVSGFSTIDALDDVDIGSGAADGDILVFHDDSNGGRWVAEPQSGGTPSVPTHSNTGLSTWLNQGSATYTDSAAGLAIDAPSDGSLNLRGLIKAAPSTPYVITAKVCRANGDTSGSPAVLLGWYDGSTKLHTIGYTQATTTGNIIQVIRWSSITSADGNDLSTNSYSYPNPLYLQISDDGTTIKFAYSVDGANFITMFSEAQSSGYLGGSNYTHIFFGLRADNTETIATLLGYAE